MAKLKRHWFKLTACPRCGKRFETQDGEKAHQLTCRGGKRERRTPTPDEAAADRLGA